MTSSSEHDLWLAHPTGKIAKGAFCSSCACFNSRNLATNAIVLEGSKLLLVQRAQEPDKGWWDIPGGYLDWDETLEECAARELKEETGLLVDPTDLTFFDIFSNPNNKAQNQVIDVYFFTKVFSGTLEIEAAEVVQAQWFDINNLPKNLAFDHLLVLQKLEKKLFK